MTKINKKKRDEIRHSAETNGVSINDVCPYCGAIVPLCMRPYCPECDAVLTGKEWEE